MKTLASLFQKIELQPLGEKPKWTRPNHKIERNEEAKKGSKVKV